MQDLIFSIRSIATLWILTAFLYPLLIFLIGQTVFPFQANGSLLTNAQGEVVGSVLIGQTFTEDKYFWGRPSVVDYSEGEDANPTGLSGGSNLASENPDLLERIKAEAERLKSFGVEPTANLLYSSGSGLDPHISPAAAAAQLERVAKARGLRMEAVQSLITQNTEGRFLGIFGDPGINVLTLNMALDNIKS
ncbi:K(+)-transporting ATPase subunit C [Synechocystis sp. PCC 6714]|uniref:K(+)-transporting ATPase subunit C n=1 Tax=Synechocystis sp. (strain PCC 6714) TaxID=1147 RepID=UPI0004201F3D|nr:K(+)-transporting ATPase subunit C [Synechocystis sp. PCC 6714]AIE76283.1 Potassium-transporting ATPase C chain [Synechocystis sp. PCC 6714]